MGKNFDGNVEKAQEIEFTSGERKKLENGFRNYRQNVRIRYNEGPPPPREYVHLNCVLAVMRTRQG